MEQHDTPILGVQPVHQAGMGRLECYFRAWRVRVFRSHTRAAMAHFRISS